jgi:hypothetical protein
LLSRLLLVGGFGSSEDDDEDEETYTVLRAVLDTTPVMDFANPVQWQAKALAVQMGALALREIAAQSCHARTGLVWLLC